LEFTLHLSELEEQTKIKDLVIEDQQKEIIELKAQVETYKKSFKLLHGEDIENLQLNELEQLEKTLKLTSLKVEQTKNRKLKEQIQDQKACVLCLDKEKNILFVPCGHLCVCEACSAAVGQCPLCRANVQQKIKAFM